MLSRLADDDLGLMLMIRHFEQALLRLFGEGMIDGTTHTCIGQEYVPVALTPLLAEGDYVFSNHRGHGHYLARHQDPVALLAEIMAGPAVCARASAAVSTCIRTRFSPLVIEFETVRLGPHSKGDDARDEAEMRALQKHFLGVPDLLLFEMSPLHDNLAVLRRMLDLRRPCVFFENKPAYAEGWWQHARTSAH